MNLRHTLQIQFVALILSSSCLLGEDQQVVLQYQPEITQSDRFNSRGAPLRDPAAILIQERSNTHKAGAADEDYFTTPQRRAQIPQMLARGDFSREMQDVVQKSANPVLWITVTRNSAGQLCMYVAMGSREQQGFDPAAHQGIFEQPPEDSGNPLDAVQIKKAHPDFAPIYTTLEREIVRKVKEPVKLDVWVYLLDGWARVDGNITTRSGKEIADEEAWFYTEGDLTALLRKIDGSWQVLYHVVAGDITAAIEVPREFPDVPEVLFPRLPPEVTGEAPAEERMAFIDGASNFRTGPTTSSQVKFQPVKGTQGSVMERQGNWIRLRLDNGDSGWGHKQNLQFVR